jgi:hypothetical protein
MLNIEAFHSRCAERSARPRAVATALCLLALVSAIACTDLKPAKAPAKGGAADAGMDAGPAGASAADPNAADTGSGGSAALDPEHPSGSGGADGTGGGDADAGPANMAATCDQDGRIRCSSGNARTRKRCEDGTWTDLEPCAAEEVCDSDAKSGCTALEAICVGNEGNTTCVGTVLYTCGSDGTSTSQETCNSAEHCAAGLASGKCPECVEGEFHCDGTSLASCVDGKFVGTQTCTTAALCNEVVGDCTTAACLPDQFVCMDDELMHCNGDQTALEHVDDCGADLCDDAHGQCDKCFADQVGCQDDQVATCSSDGQTLTLSACGSSVPKCTGQGRCVECTGDGDCSPQFCVDDECVECRNNADCVARGDGTKLCLDAGTPQSRCVQCSTPANCPTAPACRTATCSAQGICGESIVMSGSCGSGKVCNFSGVCETACGNGRYDVGFEECDATSSSFDTYTCDSKCKARSLYTPCGPGKPGCIAPAICQAAAYGSYCSPDCMQAGADCSLGAPAGSTAVCFGSLCLIECEPAPFACPSHLACPGPGSYCDVPQ